MPNVSKTYGTVSADRQKEMSGLEFVQGLVDGSLPLNTIAKTLGYDITEAESGRLVITAEPNDTHLNPAGGVHGGLSATLLDSCYGPGSPVDPGDWHRSDDSRIQDFTRAPNHAGDGPDHGGGGCIDPRSPCWHGGRADHR
jgi:hypothetical protein